MNQRNLTVSGDGPRVAQGRAGFTHGLKIFWADLALWIGRLRTRPIPKIEPGMQPVGESAGVEDMIERLCPEGLGRSDGLRDLPPAGSGKVAKGELRIRVFIGARRRDWQAHANYWILKHNESLDEGPPEVSEPRTRIIVDEAKDRMSTLVKKAQANLKIDGEQVKAALKRRDVESERYQYDGAPVPGGHVSFHVCVLLAVLLTEGALNGWFLGVRSTGLLDGLVFAFGIALVNGLVGFLAGCFGKPLVHERGTGRRFLGKAIIAVGIGALAFLNVLVGYYRDVLVKLNLDPEAGNLEEATRLALPALLDLQPMLDVQSYLMAAIGVAAAAWAFVAGWLIQSPHPGYRAAYDEHRRLEEGLAKARAKVGGELGDIITRTNAAVADEQNIQKGLPKHTPQPFRDTATKAREAANNAIATLENAGQQIIEMYRLANESARSDSHHDVVWTEVNWDPIKIHEMKEPLEPGAPPGKPQPALDEVSRELGDHRDGLLSEHKWPE